MTERRRSPRLLAREAAIGSLRIVQDVEIQAIGAEEITILSDKRIRSGERLWLQFQPAGEAARNLCVRAVEHRVSIWAGRVRQRIRLQVLPTTGSGSAW